MAGSLTEALNTLQGMFPDWDRSVLEEVLRSNGGHMENSVDQVLAMQIDNGQTSSASDSSSQGISMSTLTAGPALSSHHSVNRRRVQLPDDFLKVPGPVLSEQEIQDAMLAEMLQNEFFMREMMQNEQFQGMFGEDGIARQGGIGVRRASRQGTGESTDSGYSALPSLDDIRHKVSAMGTAARAKMSEYYKTFQARSDPARARDRHSHRRLMEGDDSDSGEDEAPTSSRQSARSDSPTALTRRARTGNEKYSKFD